MTRKILILCNDFPPINSIGADRPYSWYLYFKEVGLYPIIITKNWKTDGNNSMPTIDNVTTHEKTEFGELIRARNMHTPSTKFYSKYGFKYKIIRKALSFFEITFGYYIPFLDRHKSIYFEDVASRANLKIYFTDVKSRAGWKNGSKKSLMY